MDGFSSKIKGGLPLILKEEEYDDYSFSKVFDKAAVKAYF
jgi:hypothetical protein